MKARTATQKDAAAIAFIYNQGIEDRIATFETDAKLDGVWRDVIVVERLIETNCT